MRRWAQANTERVTRNLQAVLAGLDAVAHPDASAAELEAALAARNDLLDRAEREMDALRAEFLTVVQADPPATGPRLEITPLTWGVRYSGQGGPAATGFEPGPWRPARPGRGEYIREVLFGRVAP